MKGYGSEYDICDLHFFKADGETIDFYDPANFIEKAEKVHKEFKLA